MEENKTAEEMHPHAAGKKIGMEFLRKTQIPTTTQQRDTLFEMINKGLTQQQSAYAELKKQLKAAEKRLEKYSNYLSLTLDGVEPKQAKKDCKL